MGENSVIQWTDASYNPWRGCHKISPACAKCYMFRDQTRYGHNPDVVVRASKHTFEGPLRWSPRRIFTCSWSDFFIEEADMWRPEVYDIMARTPGHTYQILTKRPERIDGNDYAPNIWLGVSVENRRFYSRIEVLQAVECSVRFLSIEPLLGPMPDLPLDGIGWVILGGESGPGFRPLNLDWAKQILDLCRARGIPFFFKQKSAVNPHRLDRLLDGKEWSEFPISCGN